MSRICIVIVALIALAHGFASGQQAPTSILHESFEKAPIDGAVGKAGNSFSMNARGVLDLDRGRLAFLVLTEETPLDLRLPFKKVEFKNIGANTHERLLSDIDKRIDDLNLFNNHVTLDIRGTFNRGKGGTDPVGEQLMSPRAVVALVVPGAWTGCRASG